MSKDKKQMIDKVKNFNQFINEKYGDFNSIYNIIKTYIDFTLNTESQINEYVPNTHIAKVFKEVLEGCEKENMYPEIYHNITIGGYDSVEDKSKFDFIGGKYYKKEKMRISFIDHIDEYFNLDRLTKYGTDEIHKTYQKLRDKYDIIRNNLKLIDTRIPNDYNMMHKIKKDLKTDKIIIK